MSFKDTVYNIQATPKDVPELLKLARNTKRAIIFLGQPGIGKTALINQFSQKYYNGVIKPIVLARHEPQDFSVPCPVKIAENDYKTVQAVTDLIPFEEDFNGIIFFDEMGQAGSDVQKIAQELMLERSYMGKKVSDKALIVGCSNRSCDNAGSYDLLSTVANRAIIVELIGDTTQWLVVAEKDNMHPALIHFFHKFPDELFDDMDEEGCPSFTSPRSAEMASDILYQLENNEISERIAHIGINGTLGNNKWEKIKISYELVTILPDPNKIVNGYLETISEEVKDSIGTAGLFTILSGCNSLIIQELKKGEVDNAAKMVGNLINFMNNSMAEEYELLCAQINKINAIGKENNAPQLIIKARSVNPEVFSKTLMKYMQFEQELNKMLDVRCLITS